MSEALGRGEFIKRCKKCKFRNRPICKRHQEELRSDDKYCGYPIICDDFKRDETVKDTDDWVSIGYTSISDGKHTFSAEGFVKSDEHEQHGSAFYSQED